MAVGPSALDSSVLVLNKFFMAVHVVNVRRAFSLLCKELAEVISLENEQYNGYTFDSWRELSELRARMEMTDPDDDWIRTVRFPLLVPRIIRLLSYDRMPKHTVKFNRRNIFARDSNRCQYCGRRFSTQDLSLDHVVPRSRGGTATWANIVCACLKCNVKKGGRVPKEAGMRLVRKPERPKRSPMLNVRLTNSKYRSWKQFLDHAYWSVELRE